MTSKDAFQEPFSRHPRRYTAMRPLGTRWAFSEISKIDHNFSHFFLELLEGAAGFCPRPYPGAVHRSVDENKISRKKTERTLDNCLRHGFAIFFFSMVCCDFGGRKNEFCTVLWARGFGTDTVLQKNIFRKHHFQKNKHNFVKKIERILNFVVSPEWYVGCTFFFHSHRRP